MSKFHFITCVAALVLVSAPAGYGLAKTNSSQQSVKVTGHVAEVCTVNFEGSPVLSETGLYDFGVMHEFCNAPLGYTIIATGSPELSGAVMTVSGTSVTFDQTGQAILVESPLPAKISRSLILRTDAPLSANISIQIRAN